MDTRSRLRLGPAKSVGERRLLPVIDISFIEDERMMWSQADPVAVIVVEEERYYLLPISEGIAMDKLRSQIPELDNRLEDERAILNSQR